MSLRTRLDRLERAANLSVPDEFEEMERARAARIAAHPGGPALQAELDAILARLDGPSDWIQDPRACELACDLDAIAAAPEEPAP